MLADAGRIDWLCGSAERFAPFYMLVGASGYTTGAGNLAPHVTLAMHAALMVGEHDEALRLQEVLLPMAAGDGLFFTNYTWHRSEPNRTGEDRAFYAIAYQVKGDKA